VAAEMMYWKGMAQTGNGDPQAARQTFLALAQKFPDQGMWVTTALYEAAGISADMGDYDQALKLYNQVLARTKGDDKTSARVKAKIAEVKKLKSLSKPK
jgi:TolA-binding protein